VGGIVSDKFGGEGDRNQTFFRGPCKRRLRGMRGVFGKVQENRSNGAGEKGQSKTGILYDWRWAQT